MSALRLPHLRRRSPAPFVAPAATVLILFSLGLTGCAEPPRSTPAPVAEARTVVISTAPRTGAPPVISASSGGASGTVSAPGGGPAPASGPRPAGGGIENRSTDTPPGVTVSAYQPPAKMEAAPAHTPAVSQLLAEADRKEREGKLDEAADLVERALKLQPRDSHLWYKLGWLRLAQHQYEAAEEFADKSLSLAGGDLELKRSNWRLIAQARQGRGDLAGAQEAEEKAASLY
jgi:hypothetical protein